MDMKEKKLTVTGTVDPVSVVSKLRKYWRTEIITVGPAKEPEKKEEPKKEEPKKEEQQQPKRDEASKQEPKKEEQQKPAEEPKKDESKKEEQQPKKDEEPKKPQPLPLPPPDPVLELVRGSYRAYNPHMPTYYYVQSMEENPNACVIC